MRLTAMVMARAARWLGVGVAAATLVACGGGGGGTSGGTGSLRVALTDAPACGFDHVYVTIEKVRVHQSATAGDNDAGWTDLTLSPARRVDLLTLTNGVLEELGTVPLAAGAYSQVRLVLASNTGSVGGGLANAVQPSGGAEVAVATPSGQQSGLKLQAHFDVQAGQMADLVLDFDACRSIVKAGNSGQYNLKPVISVVPRIVSGILGYVTTTLTLSATTVSAQQNGVTVRSTAPDSTGKFSIPYLSTGTYTLVVASPGHATAVVTSVPAGTTTTAINASSNPIAPPVSSMADVTGTVSLSAVSGTTTVATPLTDATVRALQPLTGGPTIELASQPVDAVGATYRFSLPQAAPVKAPYAVSGALAFSADSGAAGKYTVQALSPGRTTQEKPAAIGAGSTAVDFAFGP